MQSSSSPAGSVVANARAGDRVSARCFFDLDFFDEIDPTISSIVSLIFVLVTSTADLPMKAGGGCEAWLAALSACRPVLATVALAVKDANAPEHIRVG